MNFERGLKNLDGILKRKGLKPDSEEYVDFIGWKRHLLSSLETVRRYAISSPSEIECQEKILRELDRLSLRHAGVGFLDICVRKPVEDVGTRFINAHALIMGVGDYLHPKFANLPATVHDAKAINTMLTNPDRCAYPAGNVNAVTGEKATSANIRLSLESLKNSTDSQSTVFVYFSGHGGRAFAEDKWTTFICPREADPNDLAGTAISGDEFSELLAGIPAQKMLIILDACHAAGSAGFKAAGEVTWKSGLPDKYYEALHQGSGRIVIASSKEDQFSYVRPQGDLSMFTHRLCEALDGKAAIRNDGFIRVLDVFHYVNETVRLDEPKQTPILKVKESDLNFPIAFGRIS